MLLALVFCLVSGATAPANSGGVEIVAVVDGRAKSAWTAAGEPLAGNPLLTNDIKVDRFAKTETTGDRIVVARVSGQGVEAPSVKVTASVEPNPAIFVVPDSAHPSSWLAGAAVPATQDKTSLNVGVAAGPWKPIGTVPLKKGIMGEKKGQGFLLIVRPEDRQQGGKRLTAVAADVAMPTDLTRHTYRVRLFDQAGKPFASSAFVPKPNDPGVFTYLFLGRFEDATRIELQSRAYVWKTFPNVALHRK